MSLYTWHHQGLHKPSSCAIFMLNSHWGRAATDKKSLVSMRTGSASVVSDSLQPCRLWPARILCQKGGSPGKNTGVYWPILITVPFWSTIFLAALAANPPECLVLPEPL